MTCLHLVLVCSLLLNVGCLTDAGVFHDDGDVIGDNTTAAPHNGSAGNHVGIHVASWNFEHVQEPLVITFALLVAALCKVGTSYPVG